MGLRWTSAHPRNITRKNMDTRTLDEGEGADLGVDELLLNDES